MNKVVLIGRITKDLELKYTQTQKEFADFTLAVQRTFKNSNGEYEADFIRCQAWGKTAENLCKYQGKGSQISVSGRIQTRSYENEKGERKYMTEIVVDDIMFLSKQENLEDKQHFPSFEHDVPFNGVEISNEDLPF